MPVELRYKDLQPDNGPQSAAVVGGDESWAGGSIEGILATVRDFNLEVQASMDKFLEILRTAAALRGQAGAAPGGAQRVYQPQPDPRQQILIALNAIKAQTGDVTIAELLEILVSRYGDLKLSDLIKMAGG